MGKVFAYARVSTPRQGEKGVSLPEQRAAIARYAEQHGLTVVRWFEERESAAKAGRGEFGTMLRLLRLKAADGVVIHKIDRSVRNLEDWADLGKLVDSGADIYFATENLDLKTVAGRLSADIQAVVAAHYSRNLREEAKKGIYGRLKQGFYPLRAPIGYLDQGSARPKIFDAARSELVKQAFELYSTGTVSLPNLTREMFRRGLRNRGGGPVTLNGLATILKNPFYMGLMRIRRTGESYQGNHEPLVTADLFTKVQATLAGKLVNRTGVHVFTYSRLVRCASCGYSLIAERKKGHVYYRCHNRPFKNPAVCPPTSIREEQLDTAVVTAFALIDLSEDELSAARSFIQEQRCNEEEQRAVAERSLRLQLDQVASRVSKLTDLLLAQSVSEDTEIVPATRDTSSAPTSGMTVVSSPHGSDEHVRALLYKPLRHGKTNPAGTSGYESNFSFEFAHILFLHVSRSPWHHAHYVLSATACCADLCAERFASRLLTLWTRERLVLDVTLVSTLPYFVQWHWRRRLAFRNRAAPHVFVKSRR
jgi:DNA invertase Pin-like site-specific DNA recombinase